MTGATGRMEVPLTVIGRASEKTDLEVDCLEHVKFELRVNDCVSKCGV